MAAGRRKFETIAAKDSSHWIANGKCLQCGQKITNSPKDCASEEHRKYYRARQDAVDARRSRRTGHY